MHIARWNFLFLYLLVEELACRNLNQILQFPTWPPSCCQVITVRWFEAAEECFPIT